MARKGLFRIFPKLLYFAAPHRRQNSINRRIQITIWYIFGYSLRILNQIQVKLAQWLVTMNNKMNIYNSFSLIINFTPKQLKM